MAAKAPKAAVTKTPKSIKEINSAKTKAMATKPTAPKGKAAASKAIVTKSMATKAPTPAEMVARTGNEVMAEAMRQINPDVVAAYPITPATEIVQIFAGFVADGLVDTEFVTVESEHSAMSACIGASQAGSRVMTATSSQGLALMAEMVYIAAGLRLPIVMAEVNRALSAPLNIHCDHSDTMMVRDAGWIQIFSENAQEAYDNMIQAVRIAENSSVRLPVMVTTDGFIISHGMEGISLIPDKAVQDFIGPFSPVYPLLDVDNPVTIGPIMFTDYYFESRRQVAEAMKNAHRVIAEVGAEFGRQFGRSYGYLDTYRMEDAEVAVVALGSTAGTARAAVDNMRSAGIKAGSVKVRVYRPFPAKEVFATLGNGRVKAVAVLDRSDALNNHAGPLCMDVTTALYQAGVGAGAGSRPNSSTNAPSGANAHVPPSIALPHILNYIYGLGGRDIKPADIEKVFEDLHQVVQGQAASQPPTPPGMPQYENPMYLGVRE